jgi:hypothetical protein
LQTQAFGLEGYFRRSIVDKEDGSQDNPLMILHGDCMDIDGNLPAASSLQHQSAEALGTAL